MKDVFSNNSGNNSVVVPSSRLHLGRIATAIGDYEEAIHNIWKEARLIAHNKEMASIDTDPYSEVPDVIVEQIRKASEQLLHYPTRDQQAIRLNEINEVLDSYKPELEKLAQSSENELAATKARYLIDKINHLKCSISNFTIEPMTSSDFLFNTPDY